MDIVLVSYINDLEKAKNCVQTISLHGIVQQTPKIKLIVNDTLEVYNTFKLTFSNYPNVQLYHYLEITNRWPWFLGWRSQQWIKLVASTIVETEWYLVVDSDMSIIQFVDYNNLIQNNRAFCNLRQLDEYQPQLKTYATNAYQYWGLEPDEHILRESPPIIMHTETVSKMIKELDPAFILNGNALEFHLYWAYLKLKNLDQDLHIVLPKWMPLGEVFLLHS